MSTKSLPCWPTGGEGGFTDIVRGDGEIGMWKLMEIHAAEQET